MRAALLLLGLAATPAAAQVAVPCAGQEAASIAAIVEPWSSALREYVDGMVRVALVDTGDEPACCSAHIVVLHPSGDDRVRGCSLISRDAEHGWGGTDFAKEKSRYVVGRTLVIPMTVRTYAGATFSDAKIEITVNERTGEVSVK